ncbi:MAG: T9SS type A sorting domain-containing protein [Saprospirales bacterium]|nr:T9SS type A sorting domain-containing protein [Saprospirales bacterium]
MLLCLTAHFQAQEVLNAAGQTIALPGGTVEYSVGEVATLTINPTGQAYTQGFIQPYYYLIDNTREVFDDLYAFKCFPNPVGDVLLVETNYPDFTDIQFFSMDGSVVREAPFQYNQIDCQGLPAGMYLVRLYSKNKPESKTFKLFKQ